MRKHVDDSWGAANLAAPSAATPQEAAATASRRHFIQAGGVVGAGGVLGSWGVAGTLGLTAGPAEAAVAAVPLEAYASRVSVRPGQVIQFHVRDPAGSLTADSAATVAIVRHAGWVDITELTAPLAVRNRAVPADVVSAGCAWPVSWSLTVPSTWRSGVYYAFFLGASGSGCCVPFIVRPAGKSAGVKVLVVVPTITAQARNNYGGKSVVAGNSTDKVAAPKVSFDRPFAYRFNHDFDGRQAPLARWLHRRGIAADFCADVDAHAESDLLDGYALVLKAGRDDYWTYENRAGFDAFVAAGGHAVLLGALHCASQARLEPGPRTGVANRVVVFYGGVYLDPDPRSDYKTGPWGSISLARSTEGSVGLSLSGPEYTGTGPRPPTPATVHVPHWVFDGTGLVPGSTFGADVMGPLLGGVAYYDAPALYRDPERASLCPSGIRPLSVDGQRVGGRPIPAQLTILASADTRQWPPLVLGGTRLPQGPGHIVIFSRGGGAGTVFNAGSLDWVLGLQAELQGQPPTAVARITHNLVKRLSAGLHHESVEVRNFRVGVPNPRDRYELSIGDVRTLTTYTATYQRGYLGRAYVSPVPGALPVVRYSHVNESLGIAKRYRYSLDPRGVGPGWVAEGVAFFAFASQVPNTEPIYAHYAVGDPRNSRDRGWRFFYSRHAQLPEPLDCDLDGVNWQLAGVAWYGPKT